MTKPIDIVTATHETFAPHIGSAFTLASGDGPIELRLDNVRLLSEATRRDSELAVEGRVLPPRRAFSLTFEGPPAPVLAQGMYRLEHEECGTLELFLTPFRQDRDCMLYEAAFG